MEALGKSAREVEEPRREVCDVDYGTKAKGNVQEIFNANDVSHEERRGAVAGKELKWGKSEE